MSAKSYYGSGQVQEYLLQNGLRVLILEDNTAPVFSLQTWFRVGSRHETKGLTGLAHLFEHMMFKATKNRSQGEFDRLLSEAGSEDKNAFTSRDYTGYVESLPSQYLELALELESDRMTNLIVDAAALNSEREVVQNERRFRNENSPDGTMYEALFEKTFPNTPYHWPVIGYESDLTRASVQACYEFYQSHYAPNNATIVLVGDIKASTALKLINRYYGHLKPQTALNSLKAVSSNDYKSTSASVTKLSLPLSADKVLVAYPVPSINHSDIAAIEMLNLLIGHSKISILYKKLVDAGIASGVDSFHDTKSYGGLLVITANLQRNQSAEKALKIIDSALAQPLGTLIKSTNLDHLKSMYRFETYTDLENNFSKAKNLGFMQTVAGNWDRGPQINNQIEQLNRSDLYRVFQKYISMNRRTAILGVPKGAHK